MTRPIPADPILAILRHFDPSNPDPAAAMNTAATQLIAAIAPESVNDLNDGQYAALIDRVIAMGPTAFAASRLCQLVSGGNLTLPVYEFQTYGDRGLAELDVWLLGTIY